MPSLEQALTSAGLSEKEAKVYLAALELGSAPVVPIAKKTGLSRGTTYLIAENLILRGLMSSVDCENTKHFSSEPPAFLLSRIEKESQTVDERKAALTAALPELEALVKIGGPRPSVRYYEGLQGLEAMRQILYRARHGEVLSALDIDGLRKRVSVENMRAHQRLMKRYDLGGRVLYTCSDETNEKILSESVSGKTHEHRRVDHKDFPFAGEAVIFGDTVALISYSDEIAGSIIEHRDFARTMRSLYELAWKASGPKA
jgi:HTH-type transcriptional regulator, sugar sensing transcriptional regulator